MTRIQTKWEKQDFPRSAMELWAMSDAGTDAAILHDVSGKDRNLAAASSAPVLQAGVINNLPSVYFDGTKNPLIWSGEAFNLNHVFLVVAAEGATFNAARGLISSGDSAILTGANGTDKFTDLALGENFVFRKSDVVFTQNNQKAPLSSKFAVIEIVFKTGLDLSSLQIGQEMDDVAKKWKGWISEVIVFSRTKNYFERQQIYQYFARKFHLWRELADGTRIFPFPNNHQSPFTSLRYKIQSPALPNGKMKTRVKGAKLKQFDFNYATRRQDEAQAIDRFETEFFDGRIIAVENNSFYPPRRFNVIPTSDVSMEPAGLNLWGYKFSGRQADTLETIIEIPVGFEGVGLMGEGGVIMTGEGGAILTNT